MTFADVVVSVDQNLVFTTAVAGQTIAQPFDASGEADWVWVEEGETIQLDNANWMSETPPGTDSSPVPSMGIPGNGIVEIECTPTSLRFGGVDATLTPNFTR